MKREVLTAAIIAILSFSGCLLFGGLLFTGEITTDKGALINELNTNNTNLITNFVFEKSIYVYVHHIMNYIFLEYFGTFQLFLLGEIENPSRSLVWDAFVTTFLKVLGYAAFWEFDERFLVWILLLLLLPTNLKFVANLVDIVGTGENIWNTLLSDLPQAMIPAIGIEFLVFTRTKKPISFILHKRKIWNIVLLFAWLQLSMILSILGSFKTRYKGSGSSTIIVPYGLFCFFLSQFFFTSCSYLYDIHIKQDVMTTDEITTTYIETLIYIFFIFLSTGLLTLPGLLTSNISFLLFVAFVYFYKKGMKSK